MIKDNQFYFSKEMNSNKECLLFIKHIMEFDHGELMYKIVMTTKSYYNNHPPILYTSESTYTEEYLLQMYELELCNFKDYPEFIENMIAKDKTITAKIRDIKLKNIH